jgi:hypothetical protein
MNKQTTAKKIEIKGKIQERKRRIKEKMKITGETKEKGKREQKAETK